MMKKVTRLLHEMLVCRIHDVELLEQATIQLFDNNRVETEKEKSSLYDNKINLLDIYIKFDFVQLPQCSSGEKP